MSVREHRRVTEQGRSLGKAASRLAELGRRRLAAAGLDGIETVWTRADMCASCAYRVGTIPNGCLQTQLDALKCVVDGVPFYCHAPSDGAYCTGWLRARAEQAANPMPAEVEALVAKWQLSPPDASE